jgi:hypothetical protein
MGKGVRADGRVADRGIFIADDDRARLEALLHRAATRDLSGSQYLAALAGSCGVRAWSRGPRFPETWSP